MGEGGKRWERKRGGGGERERGWKGDGSKIKGKGERGEGKVGRREGEDMKKKVRFSSRVQSNAGGRREEEEENQKEEEEERSKNRKRGPEERGREGE